MVRSVTVHILQRIHDTWMNSPNPDRVMLWAVAAAAFFLAFFRLGELLSDTSAWNNVTDLAWGDVAVDNHAAPTMVQIHLKTSKCDQAGQGADVVLGSTEPASAQYAPEEPTTVLSLWDEKDG